MLFLQAQLCPLLSQESNFLLQAFLQLSGCFSEKWKSFPIFQKRQERMIRLFFNMVKAGLKYPVAIWCRFCFYSSFQSAQRDL